MCLIKVLHPSFFAREDTKTPMIYAGIAMAANVVLSIMLFLLIGATGIAIATALSGWINVGLLLIGTLRQREGFTLDPIFRRRVCRHRRRQRGDGCRRVCPGETARSWFARERSVGASVRPSSPWSRLGLLTYLGAAHLFGAANFAI